MGHRPGHYRRTSMENAVSAFWVLVGLAILMLIGFQIATWLGLDLGEGRQANVIYVTPGTSP